MPTPSTPSSWSTPRSRPRSNGWSRDRGWTEEDARSRVAAQASREDRLAVATYVVENTGTREALRERVEEVWADLHARQGS